MRVYVVDPGYGNFKIAKITVNPEAGRIQTSFSKVPSAVSEIPEWSDSLKNTLRDTLAVSVYNRNYIVGKEALSCGVPIPTLTPGWLENFGIPVFVKAFCADFDRLYILLSMSDWDKKDTIISRIREIFPEKTSDQIFFLVQGSGIWVEAGRPGDAVVLDIGFNTVDVLVTRYRTVERNGRTVKVPFIPRELCFSLKEAGLVSFLEKASKDDPFRIARLLEGGDEYLTRLAREHYFEWLKTRFFARSEWRGVAGEIRHLVIGGGGAFFVEPEREDFKITIVREPDMANVKGMTRVVVADIKSSLFSKAEQNGQAQDKSHC